MDGLFPEALHICTYDVRGTLRDTGQLKPVRVTGLVTHTHHLLHALARRHPQVRLAITQTGAATARHLGEVLTPEGLTADLRAVATRFPKFLGDPRGGKSARLVQRYYEDTIGDSDNPVWASLAGQYARAIRQAAIPDVLLQNINPLVSVLKAEEAGLLPARRMAPLRVTGVLHDSAGAGRRLGYLAERAGRTGLRLRLIAVSRAVQSSMVEAGVPDHMVRTVLNGMDTAAFDDRLRQAREDEVWARVAARNRLPVGHRIVLVSARRVAWKGHEDVIRAAARLNERGLLDTTVVVFNGAGLTDTRAPGYENELVALIDALALRDKVRLLDTLNAEEVAACYTAAHVAVHPSREPEPFGYANLEAMLAGAPVVAAGHGGPLEYITDDHSGLLVPPRAPSAIAAAVERLLTDDALHARVAVEGRASAMRFTSDAMFDGYAEEITAAPVAATAGAR
jgi:glycosyltransferase involved in cell wall biosynthesis